MLSPSIDRAGRNPGFQLFHGFTGKAEVGILLLADEDREDGNLLSDTAD